MLRNNNFILIGSIVVLFLLSCCDATPRKSDIKSKIKGTYCNASHKLILTDSTYINTKFQKGLLADTPYTESCKGKYLIDMKEGHWIIRFEKDPNPRAISNCQQEYTIWTEKEGYLIGEDIVTLRDLFDNTPVTKNECK